MGPVRPMKMRHVNGTATTTPTKFSVNKGIGQYIVVSNTDTTNDLLVSFDNGRNSFTVAQGTAPIQINALFHWVVITSSAGTCTFEMLFGEG